MITVHNHVGRLLEMRFVAPTPLSEAQTLGVEVFRIFEGAANGIVSCGDFRGSGVYSAPVAEALVGLMRQHNPKVLRSGYLIGGQSLFAVQLEAMTLAARNPGRRTFREKADLRAWLGELLTEAEKERLDAFLAEVDDEGSYSA